MRDTYVCAFYHFAWATKRREPLIAPEWEHLLYAHLSAHCVEMGVKVYAVNGMPDHMHLVCTVPPSLAVSNVLHDLKGRSAYFINHSDDERALYWQRGFGMHTFARNELDSIVAYVQNQKQRHQTQKLWDSLENFEKTNALGNSNR